MYREQPLDAHVRDAAYFAWQKRVLGGAPRKSTPQQEKSDWLAGKREIEHMLGMVDLCRQLLNCIDVAKKIRLAVTFFVAEAKDVFPDAVTEQTLLPKDVETRRRICQMVGNATINTPLALSKSAKNVGELMRALQRRAQKLRWGKA